MCTRPSDLHQLADIDVGYNLGAEFTSTPTSFVAYVGRRYNYEIDYTDPEGQPIALIPTTFDLPRSSFYVPSGSKGLFTWLPNEAQLGEHVVTLRLRDPAFNITEQVFTVTVLPDPNTAPVINSQAPGTAYIGSQFTYQVEATDADDEPLTYSVVSGPSDMTIDPDTGLLDWTVSGAANSVVSVEIAASDGITETTQSFDINLSDTPPETDPPVITLSTDPGASISGQFDLVGSITDENMGNWSVTAIRSGIDGETSLSTGSDVIENLSLATLDTTLLRNGLYTLVVSATDIYGNAAEKTLPVVIDGNDKVGTFSVSFEDLSIPMLGVPIEITRTYDSRRRSEDLDFGYGWSIDYQNVTLQESGVAGAGWSFIDEFVLVDDGAGGSFPIRQFCVKRDEPAFVTVTLPDDSVDKFRVMAGPECNIANAILDVNLDFEPLDDTTSTLQALDDNFGRLNNTLGVLSDIAETDPLDPQRYALTTLAGYVYILSEDFGLEQVQDPNGNTLSYTNNGIIHSAGKSVLFVRDANGRITQIQDPSGNLIGYTYDVNDDLTAVTDRESSTTTMTYNNDHGLIDIIDPLGTNVIRNIYDNDGRLIAQEDNLGNRTDFNHNLSGRESNVTDRLGRTTFMYYDERGNVTSQINALGEIATYTYDANDNQLTETNALGETSSATFDAENNQLTQTDALNNTVSYAYNNLGQEITITDARGNTFNNAYDPLGNLLSIIDPAGNVTTQSLNANGLVNARTDAEGFVTNFIYDTDGNVTREIDAEGGITDYTYDTNNNRTSETRKRTVDGQTVDETTSYTYNSRDQLVSTTDALGNTTTTEYDLLARESATIDPLGRRTEMAYDAYGRLISTTYPDGTSNTMTYDVEGNKLTDTDRLGRTTSYSYDALNRLTQTTYPDGTTTSMVYDAAGRISTETDERGNTTTYSYDAAGRRTLTTDALGNTQTYAYDADGNMVTMTDARNNATSYTYNNLDQRVRTTFADNTIMESSFDARGMETNKTDQNGRATNYDYDGLGRLTSVTDALGQITTYGYDEVGNQLTQTDALGRTTTWTYDALGRQTTRSLPLEQVESFTYDAVGNRTSHTDFNGATHTFVYEANNDWLVAEQYADSQVIGYSYNAVGSRSTATDSNGTTTYSYDSRNRLINELKHDGSELIYGYDAAGNKITMSSIVSGTTRATGYTYDALNRMATVTDANGGVTTYTYDENGNQTGITHSNGTSTTTTFDDLNRITLIEHKDSGNGVLASFSYTLDPTGRRTLITEEDGRTSTYIYNDLYRLIGEDIVDPVNGNHTASWTYDAVGNRLTDTTNGVATNYNYDANDRLLTQGSKSFTYDDNGSTTSESDGVTTDTFIYDSRNKLVEAMVNGSLLSMSYDMDGNRVGKTVDSTPVNYVVDNNQSYAQVVVEELATDTLDYTFGTDLLNLDSLSGGYTYHTDALGSNRLITDSVGSTSDELGYDAWGDVLAGGNLAENQYRYTGEQFDGDLDRVYLRARYLDVSHGFTQMDDWIGNNSNPITLNKYIYANDNPANVIDPTGKYGIAFAAKALTITGLLAATGYQADYLYFGTIQRTTNNQGSYYHNYESDSNIICTKQEISWCSKEEVWKWMQHMPAPRAMSTSYLAEPLIDGDSTCCIGGGLPFLFGGQINVEIGRYFVNNVTTKLHTLAYGRVDRRVVDDGGAIRIETNGYGENRLAFIAFMNDRVGPKVFNSHDEQIRKQILVGRAGN